MMIILRRIASACYSLIARAESLFDAATLDPAVPSPPRIAHPTWKQLVFSLGNKEGFKVLEVGSREVCGPSTARSEFDRANYTGFDYYPGKNVDVVGDAHRLSSYFPKGTQFDLIFSSACFEHFAMPWVVAVEISKLLKVGGYVFVETHFAFSSHERPWHFFHFTDMALRSLFSEQLGFECIESGMSAPIVGRFTRLAPAYLRHRRVPRMYAFSEYLGRKAREVEQFDWQTIDVSTVVGGTHYPKPTDI